MKLIKAACITLLVATITTLPARAVDLALNGKLEVAASACEDMIEIAADAGIPAARSKVVALRKALVALRGNLSPVTTTLLDAHLKLIESRSKSGSVTNFSLAAVETFGDIVKAMDWSARPVRLQVALLDYTGFKLNILASSRAPDWKAIKVTSAYRGAAWKKLKPAITAKGLLDLAVTIGTGMDISTKRHDAQMLAFAAKVELDSVDLIEAAFEQK
jgi:hypothetical protein